MDLVLIGIKCSLDGREGRIENIVNGELYISFKDSPHIQLVNPKHISCVNGELFVTTKLKTVSGCDVGCHEKHCAKNYICDNYR